ncbi:probable ferric reductase transmembrane component 8 [[Candida] anglica]
MSFLNVMEFRYPATKSPESTQRRQCVTDEYALLTTIVMALVIFIGVPMWRAASVWRSRFTWTNLGLLNRANTPVVSTTVGSAATVNDPADISPNSERDPTQLSESATSSNSHSHQILQPSHSHTHIHTMDHSEPVMNPAHDHHDHHSPSKPLSILSWTFYHSTTLLHILLWIIILLPLSFTQTNNDLIYLAKRLGKIPTVCLPFTLFLSLRPSPLPKVLYLSLLPIHKWLSRVVIVQSVAHVTLYLGYFQYKNTWSKMWKLENLYGWVALLGFLIIIITSLSPLRKRYYSIFFINHYIWTWLIVISLQFHARPVSVTPYTLSCLLVLSGQIVYRVYLTRVTTYTTDVQVIDISPNLALVEFPSEVIAQRATSPGAHIRLAKYSSSFIARTYHQLVPNYHPYTLVSLPSDRYQKLIVRKGKFALENDRKYLICGSYDPHLAFISNSNATTQFSISKLKIDIKRLLVVVGGSAISFALPIARVMNYHGIPVKIVWVVRDFRDVVVLGHVGDFIQPDDLEIFVTGNPDFKDEKKEQIDTEIVEIDIGCRESEDEVDECSFMEDEGEQSESERDSDKLDSNHLTTTTTPLNRQKSTRSFKKKSQDFTENSPLLFNVDEGRSESPPTPFRSRKSSVSSHSETFVLPTDIPSKYTTPFLRTVSKLNLANKIYKGRPTLNHRYLHWCTNRSNFTQCSGPIATGDNSFVCCREIADKPSSAPEVPSNCWVVSAGPRELVRNVALWSRENGLQYHEESFNV